VTEPLSTTDPSRTDATPRPPLTAALRGNVLLMGIVSFFTDASSEMIYPLLPVFFTGLVPVGLAAVYLGIMEGVAETVASLLKIVSGRLSDAVGRRKAPAVLGYGISTVARPAMALASAGWHPVLLRLLDRIGKGVRSAPRDALLSDSVGPDARGLAFSFHRAMDHAGAVLGPALAAAILFALLGQGILWGGTVAEGQAGGAASTREMEALRWVFAVALVPGLVALLVLALGVREIAPKRARAERTDGAKDERKVHQQRLPRHFYIYLASVTVFALGNSSDLFLVLLAKTSFDLGLFEVLGLWVALHVSKIAFSFPGGIISDRMLRAHRLGRRGVIIAGWAIYAVVYLAMAFEPGPAAFWALIALYGAYYGLTEGAEKALVADLVESDRRGRAYGLYHGAVGLAALPASLLFGVFWAALGPQVAFGIGAALAAVAAGILAAVPAARWHG
jgi:MFS family permease